PREVISTSIPREFSLRTFPLKYPCTRERPEHMMSGCSSLNFTFLLVDIGSVACTFNTDFEPASELERSFRVGAVRGFLCGEAHGRLKMVDIVADTFVFHHPCRNRGIFVVLFVKVKHDPVDRFINKDGPFGSWYFTRFRHLVFVCHA